MRERVAAGAIARADGRIEHAFHDIAGRGDVGAEAGIPVVGRGTGHSERERAAGLELAEGNRVAVVVAHREGYGRFLAGASIAHAGERKIQAGKHAGLIGNHVRAGDGRVETQGALRIMASGAGGIAGFGAGGMIGARGEVYVVVARSAGGARRIGEPGIGLRRAVFGIVAGLAAADVGGVDHGGEVAHRVLEADNLVRLSALHAGQRAAHVDLVDEDLEIEGIAGVRVGGLRLMAHDAELDIAARTAMRGQAGRSGDADHAIRQPVTLIAIGGAYDVARLGRAAGGDEVEGGVGVVGSEVVGGQIARAVNADAVRRGGVEAGGGLGAEGIYVLAGGDGLCRAAGIGRGLRRRRASGCRNHGAHDI